MHANASLSLTCCGGNPGTIVREAWWRVRRSYLKRQFARRDFNRGCPVRFRPLGYYDRLQRLGSGADSSPLIDYADAVPGEFRFLGHADAKLGLPPSCWSLDFVSGKRCAAQVSADRVVLIAGDGSDVKVLWDSRLQFLPVLAKAFRLTADARFRRCALDLLSDWIERNPVGVGIHWTVAMEDAARREHLPDA